MAVSFPPIVEDRLGEAFCVSFILLSLSFWLLVIEVFSLFSLYVAESPETEGLSFLASAALCFVSVASTLV
jgi:hypothetical protein